MMDDPYTLGFWALIFSVALGLGAVIAAFIKLPPEQRRLSFALPRRPSLEEQLAKHPPSAEAVIIRVDRRRFLRNTAIWVVFILLLVSVRLWMEFTPHPECAHALGYNAFLLIVFIAFYGMPFFALTLCLSVAWMGVKTLRSGYYPPLDTTVFGNTIAIKGLRSRLRGIAMLLTPLIGLVGLDAGQHAYTSLSGGMTVQQFSHQLDAKCNTQPVDTK